MNPAIDLRPVGRPERHGVVMSADGRWMATIEGDAIHLVDRLTYGMVIDFMNVGIGPLRTGIFNVADMAIMLGAGIFAVEGYRSDRRAPSTAPS